MYRGNDKKKSASAGRSTTRRDGNGMEAGWGRLLRDDNL